MEKFLGITPRKKFKKDEDRQQQQREYETTKRIRNFQDSWLRQFPWLEYHLTNGKGKMYCQCCRKYDSVGSFSTGSDNFKLESIKCHEKSKSHVKYAAICQAKEKSTSDSTAAKTLMTINKHVVERISNMFRIAHSLAKHGRPYTDFPWMCDLSERMGVDVGQTYRNDKRAQEMVFAIAESQREVTRERVSESKFLAVISDGATDSSHKEAEIIFVRTSKNGEVDTNFVAVTNIGKPDATEIEKAISTKLSAQYGESWKSKLVATGTDGASVMLGKKNGVVQKLSDRVGRNLIGVHCSAHKLELSYKDACSKVSFYGKVATLLTNLYYFYRNSPLNRHNLKESFKTYGRNARMPSRVCGTRWLPHTLRAIANIVHGLGPVVTHLSQVRSCGQDKTEKGAKAKNFLNLLQQKDVVYFLHFLWDVVSVLSKVSLKFQERSTTVAEIYQEIEAAKAILETYRDRFWE